MEFHLLTTSLLLLLCFTKASVADVLFSSLPQTLVLSASPHHGQVLKAGEDSIAVTLSLNQSYTEGIDDSYKEVKVKLCYAPISQVDRGWRKTADKLNKDKTCQYTITQRTYTGITQSFNWTIEKDVASAVYFVRAYVYNSTGKEIAYGQTTDGQKSINLLKVQASSGRHQAIEFASICFSAFAVLSLVGFFMIEKRDRRLAKK